MIGIKSRGTARHGRGCSGAQTCRCGAAGLGIVGMVDGGEEALSLELDTVGTPTSFSSLLNHTPYLSTSAMRAGHRYSGVAQLVFPPERLVRGRIVIRRR